MPVLLTTTPARAATSMKGPRVHLELQNVTGRAGCVDAPGLEEQVEARLNRRVFSATSAELKLVVELSRRGASWTARLTLSDAAGVLGQRELRSAGRHCSTLDDSLALVVALLVDTPTAEPELAGSQPEQAPQTESRSSAAPARAAPAPAPPPTPILLPHDTAAPREPWAFQGAAAFLLSAGALPGLVPGLELAIQARPPRAPELRISLDGYRGERGSVAVRDAGARFLLMRAGLELCLPISEGPKIAWEGCAGQRVGRLAVEGYGFDQNSSRIRILNSLSASFSGVLRLSEGLGLALGAQLELPLQRENFLWRDQSGNAETVFQQAWLFMSGKIGLRWAP